jgi:hypothetical protein
MARKAKVGVYRRDTTDGENCIETVIRAALEYNKNEAKRWRVSVEMIQACRAAGSPAQRASNESPVVRTSVDLPMIRIPKHGRNAFNQ